mmetsp:Transcript_20981/g.32006  ORF Transcript_20981/g.32006 Transcript_20981/m.32006 type:complete len:704 (+) Transcript_20981:94-2205(+)
MMFRCGNSRAAMAALRRKKLMCSTSSVVPSPVSTLSAHARLWSSTATPEHIMSNDANHNNNTIHSSTVFSKQLDEAYRMEQSSLYFRSAEAMHHLDDQQRQQQSIANTTGTAAGDAEGENNEIHGTSSSHSNANGADTLIGSSDSPPDMNIVAPDSDTVKLSRAMCGRIEHALSRGDAPEVMRLYMKAEDEADRYYLRTGLLREMLIFLCQKAESGAFTSIYRVFYKYYRDCKERGFEVQPQVFHNLCYALGVCRVKPDQPIFMGKVVNSLMKNIEKMEEVDQHRLLPELLVSLAQQNNRFVQNQAQSILQKIQEEGIDMKKKYLSKILEIPTGPNGTNVPRHLVLQLMVERGIQPYNPASILRMIESQYPFGNPAILGSYVDSLTHLIKAGSVEGERRLTYSLSEGLIEAMMTSASDWKKFRYSNVLLKIWDLMELLGHEPTESMYESAIKAFLLADRQDQHAFAVFTEMESKGFTPSWFLIKSVSKVIRSSIRRLDHAYYMLTNNTPEGITISTAILNCILCACAEEGLADRSFAVFEDFENFGLQPDVNSFSFLMEGLAVQVSQIYPMMILDPTKDQPVLSSPIKQAHDDIQMYLDSSEAVIMTMEEQGIERTRQVIHHYVSILSGVGELEKAKSVLRDAVDKDEWVFRESFEQLALQYARKGDRESALEVASMVTENGYDEIPATLSSAIDHLLSNQEE